MAVKNNREGAKPAKKKSVLSDTVKVQNSIV